MEMAIHNAGGFVENPGIIRGAVYTTGGANTKGAYTALIASTGYDCDGLYLSFMANAIANKLLVDVAIGGAGAEVIILSNFLVNNAVTFGNQIYIPIEVPAGSRIAVRAQSNTASAQSYVVCHLVRGGLWKSPGGGTVETLGDVTGTSRGTTIDPGTSLSTWGAWIQLSAATVKDIVALWPQISIISNAAMVSSPFGMAFQVGVGAAAAEQIALGPLTFSSITTFMSGWPQMWLPCQIPQGSRISARGYTLDTVDATDRLYDLCLYGLNN